MRDLLAFASGIGVAVVAGLCKTIFDRLAERRGRIATNAFEVYMLLLELNSIYFFVASADETRSEQDPEINEKAHRLAWQICDKLRYEDRIPMINELLTILQSETAYPDSSTRHDAMESLAGELGRIVNPRYSALTNQISAENIKALKDIDSRRAPALLWALGRRTVKPR